MHVWSRAPRREGDALTKYTITVAADHGREASARIHIESRHGRFQILEWTVLAAPNGHATTPALVTYIVDAFIRDNGLIPQTPVHTSELGLSKTTHTYLSRAGITRVAHLTTLTLPELLTVKGLGLPRTDEIGAALDNFGLALADRENDVATTGDVAPHRSARTGGERRAYRRRPDDFVEVYELCAGSPAAIAAHYDLPYEAIKSWLRSARRSGSIPPGRGPGRRRRGS